MKKHSNKHHTGPKCTWLPDDYEPPNKKKFLGYCKCGNMITTGDLESKCIFICPSCKNRATKGRLNKDKSKDLITKKEWREGASVQSVVEINHEIDPDSIKIIE